MHKHLNTTPQMSSPATYSIKVKGRLTDAWADWFNGTLENYVRLDHGVPETLLTCRVRDQAELLGILKQINALNLPLIQVILVEGRRIIKGAGNHEA